MDDATTRIRDLARSHGNAAIKTLVDIMEDDDAKASARVAAARSVLERGFGTAERHTTSTVDVNVFDAREAHFSALKKLASSPALPRVDKTIDGTATRLPPPTKTEYEE